MSTEQLHVGGPPGLGVPVADEAAGFAPLRGSAVPVAQDRWERLVSTVVIPEPPRAVWAALTDPDRVSQWFGVCRGDWARTGAEVMLDFEDGEFFWCRTQQSSAPGDGRPGVLRYLWRWVGIGPATSVTWTVEPAGAGTSVTVVEEAVNPPSDWRSWNGMGWPGILDQLAAHLRTGTEWRWPWRRMGPYLQIPLPAPPFQAWEALTAPGAVRHWLQPCAGSLAAGEEMTVVMGDASGRALLRVTKLVDSGQEFPSYLPHLEFELRRASWPSALGGRIWIEPVGLRESLLQVFHDGWEDLGIPDAVTERKIVTGYWVSAAARAQMLLQQQGPPDGAPVGPHGWSISGGEAEAGRTNGHGPAPAAVPAESPAMDFAGRAMSDLGGAMTSVLCVLGLRLGLFRALAGAGRATAAELAGLAGCDERYLLEWLHGMASAGYLERHGGQRFSLPAGAAAVLADDSPMSLAAGYELVPPLVDAVREVEEAFRTGTGVPHDRYPQQLFLAMERMSRTWLDTMLVPQWIPAVDGLSEALARGGTVVDVGCGGGHAVLRLARAFEAAGFVGFDLHEPNVHRARAAAVEAGVAGRVRFEHQDAAEGLPEQVDLVTMFDVLHDAPDPGGLLRAVRGALREDTGAVLVLETNCAEDAADNTGPGATILYATSTLYCLPSALSQGAPGLGTLGLPPGKLRELATASGFRSVERIPMPSPMNALYVLRP
ncbi:SRPBCC domain-containing protein [Saccharopolyspora sp. NPDC050642]|uniref:SRPBCC domain-containing protein n=1 Tax=Saccharopolyspora sp. NPDC050642 TaxID=3157099 RepID=UPI0033E475B3